MSRITVDKISEEASGDPVAVKKQPRLSFSKSTLNSLDIDGDGVVTEKEIEQFVSNARLEALASNLYKRLMILIIGLLFGVVILVAGLTALSVEELKESHVDTYSVMVDLDGNPVQCASREMFVDENNGALMRRSGESGENGSPTLGVGQGIRTLSVPHVEHPLSSRVPDKYLLQLREFTAIVDGMKQYVQVHSFRRVIDVTAQCGSTVLLVTNLGEFKLDATHLWYHGGVVDVMGIFAKGRKLSADTLIAFYDDVEEMEFECFTEWMGKEDEVEKPSMPALPMSFTVVRHEPCLRMVYSDVEMMGETTLTDMCGATVGGNARRTKPGVSENPGENWLVTIDHVLVTETEQVTVSYMPNHPLQRIVKVVDSTQVESTGNKTVMQYQLYRDGSDRLYCEQSEIEGGGDLDFESLHYLGSGIHQGTDVRKWATGIMATNFSAEVDSTDGEFPQDMSLDFGVATNMYAEFWDTDDENHLPYYFGMHSAPAEYDAAYYKSVKVGLTAEDVTAWKAKEMGAGGEDASCRKGRNQIREGNFWLGAPSITNAFTELHGDIDFYLQRLVEGANVKAVAFQAKESYTGYWGLALHEFAPESNEGRRDSKYLADMIGHCEGLTSTTNYDLCMHELQAMMALSDETLEWMENNFTDASLAAPEGGSGRRQLGRSYESCRLESDCLTGTGNSLKDCFPPGSNAGWAFDLDQTVPVDFDGIEFEYEQKDKYETNHGSTFTRKIKHTKLCQTVAYEEVGRGVFCGTEAYRSSTDDPQMCKKWCTDNRNCQAYVTYENSNCDSCVAFTANDCSSRYQRRTSCDGTVIAYNIARTAEVVPVDGVSEESETVPAGLKFSRSTYFGFKLSGESESLEGSSFYQELTGSGGITVHNNLITGVISASGQGEVKYEAGRQTCAMGGIATGVLRAGFFLEGKVVVTAGAVSFELSAGLTGSGAIYTQGWGWDQCRCSGKSKAGTCDKRLSATISGKLTVKVAKMWCGKTPEISLTAEIKAEVCFGPLCIGVAKTFDIVKNSKLGQKWKC